MRDIFTSHLGPRLRDRISHGMISANTHSIPKCLVKLVQIVHILISLPKSINLLNYQPKFDTIAWIIRASRAALVLKASIESLQKTASDLRTLDTGEISTQSSTLNENILFHNPPTVTVPRTALILAKHLYEIATSFTSLCEELAREARNEVTNGVPMRARRRAAVLEGGEVACENVWKVCGVLMQAAMTRTGEPKKELILAQRTESAIGRGLACVWREVPELINSYN
ncbi:hypothetical protein HK096_010606 [Nowakowskiella sp. JEL0078]|nr:hypothetical protein HK096_010606 [Nowakowskiella sp. JEL0078]